MDKSALERYAVVTENISQWGDPVHKLHNFTKQKFQKGNVYPTFAIIIYFLLAL